MLVNIRLHTWLYYYSILSPYSYPFMLCLFRIFSPLKDNPAYCLRNNRAGPWLSHYHTFDENCWGSVWFGQAILVTRGRIIFCSVRTCEGSCDAFGLICTWGGQVKPKWFRFGLERLGFQMTWGGLIVLVCWSPFDYCGHNFVLTNENAGVKPQK